MDCVLQLPGPQASGWAWPMGAPTGDQREGGEGFRVFRVFVLWLPPCKVTSQEGILHTTLSFQEPITSPFLIPLGLAAITAPLL